MLTKRIIPCLDIKDGKVVKGVNFVGLKDVGDPIELAKKYPEESITKGCLDVLSRYDIVNKYDNGELTKTIKELAEHKTLDKNSKKFYIEYLENLNSSSD